MSRPHVDPTWQQPAVLPPNLTLQFCSGGAEARDLVPVPSFPGFACISRVQCTRARGPPRARHGHSLHRLRTLDDTPMTTAGLLLRAFVFYREEQI